MKRCKIAEVLIERLREMEQTLPYIEKEMKSLQQRRIFYFLVSVIGKLKKAVERIG